MTSEEQAKVAAAEMHLSVNRLTDMVGGGGPMNEEPLLMSMNRGAAIYEELQTMRKHIFSMEQYLQS